MGDQHQQCLSEIPAELTRLSRLPCISYTVGGKHRRAIMVSVGGRNPKLVIRLCLDMAEARSVAQGMVDEGFTRVTIGGKAFDPEEGST